jgi:cytochrome oxidase Cu insertion factor (SCO1/SenC/PrrC family)
MMLITRKASLVAAIALSSGCGWKLETREAVDPSTVAAPRELASAFSLANDDGSFVSLDDLLGQGRPALLVFYRGHW